MSFERCKSDKRIGRHSGAPRSLSDIDRSQRWQSNTLPDPSAEKVRNLREAVIHIYLRNQL
jgi:hypothetical protein